MTDGLNPPPDSAGPPEDIFATAEEKLEQTSQATATHAFNLAISFGLLPLIIIMLMVFIFVRGSLPALLITGILSALALIIFASLVVNTSRERALQRVYQEQVLPELLASARQLEIASFELPVLAQQRLPEGALLLKYLTLPEAGPTPEISGSPVISPTEAEPAIDSPPAYSEDRQAD